MILSFTKNITLTERYEDIKNRERAYGIAKNVT